MAKRKKVKLGKKCLVLDCENRMGEGTFHGDLCSACYRILRTGRPVPTKGILGIFERLDCDVLTLHDFATMNPNQLATVMRDVSHEALKHLDDHDPANRKKARSMAKACVAFANRLYTIGKRT